MNRTKTLKELTYTILRYVGNGYKDYKITHIPQNKLHKTAQILTKIEKHYQTSLTSGKRQYRKKKGLANYQGISFLSMIIIFRTPGKNTDNLKEFKRIDKSLNIEISKDLTLILFEDERKKLTYRLSKENYSFFVNEIKKAYDKKDGRKYHTVAKMFNNLAKLKYKGIGKQKTNLNELIKKLQKDNNIKGWGLL